MGPLPLGWSPVAAIDVFPGDLNSKRRAADAVIENLTSATTISLRASINTRRGPLWDRDALGQRSWLDMSIMQSGQHPPWCPMQSPKPAGAQRRSDRRAPARPPSDLSASRRPEFCLQSGAHSVALWRGPSRLPAARRCRSPVQAFSPRTARLIRPAGHPCAPRSAVWRSVA
jgi:hypothetical protein